MSLKSRYRLMRLRNRTGGGGMRRLASTVLLVAVAALVMVTGLVAVVALLFAAAVVVSAIYVWSRLRRIGLRRRNRHRSRDGITIEGEYTVQRQDYQRHDSKR